MTKRKSFSLQLFSQFPDGIKTLFFIQMFSTFSFSVLYSSIALYITNHLGFSKVEANTITGFFLAFNYALHLLGGYFGGRLMSNRSLFAWGMVLIIAGCLVLSIPSKSTLYFGIALFLTGSGLNVTCLNCMVTQRFEANDKRREHAFFWIYSAMNVGFFTGFSFSGMFEKLGNYQPLFFISAVGNFIALCLLLKHWAEFKDRGTILSKCESAEQHNRKRLGFCCVLLMIPTILLLINYASLANRLVMFAGVAMMFVLFCLAMRQSSKAATHKMYAFIILMLASSVFWTLYQIAPMGLTFFIKNNVDAQLFGYLITPQWLQNVNTIVIIIGGPITGGFFLRLRAKGVKINIPVQFSLALFLIGIGFSLVTIGISQANAEGFTHINWVILSYVLQSLGELLLSPVGYAMIGQLAPTNLQGLMMGSWMMISGVAATMSNYFSNQMVGSGLSNSPLITNDNYSHVFAMLGWGAIIAAVVLLLLAPSLMRLINGCGEELDNTLEAEAV